MSEHDDLIANLNAHRNHLRQVEDMTRTAVSGLLDAVTRADTLDVASFTDQIDACRERTDFLRLGEDRILRRIESLETNDLARAGHEVAKATKTATVWMAAIAGASLVATAVVGIVAIVASNHC